MSRPEPDLSHTTDEHEAEEELYLLELEEVLGDETIEKLAQRRNKRTWSRDEIERKRRMKKFMESQ